MNRRRFLFLASYFMLLSSCGPAYLISLPSLSQKLPKVVEVEPHEGDEVEKNIGVKIKFSVPVDPLSINKGTLLIVEGLEDNIPSKVSTQVSKGELNGIEGAYLVSDDGLLAEFVPSSELEEGNTYGIVASTSIRSEENFNLAGIFISKFIVKKDAEDKTEKGDEESDGKSDVPSDEEKSAESDEGAVASGSEAIEGEKPAKVVINELYYDAEGSDENAGLFIELAGEAGTDIGDFEIVFVNGDDGKIADTIKLPSDAKIADSGLYVVANATNIGANYVTNFDPQNGPDAAQLLNKEKNILDAVCYGEVKVKIAENGFEMCEGTPAADSSSGTSISRNLSSEDTNDNSKDFIAEQIPTPNKK